ncbi:MAG: hypothetical protein KKC01_09965 [Gammaproteobacteria bacterium]|nr:hypothetical protein [Gammaproteobacteria bacterium]
MSKRHNDPFIVTIYDNNIVWESAKNEAFCSAAIGAFRHGRKRKKTVFYHINSRLNRLSKLGAEALPL